MAPRIEASMYICVHMCVNVNINIYIYAYTHGPVFELVMGSSAVSEEEPTSWSRVSMVTAPRPCQAFLGLDVAG